MCFYQGIKKNKTSRTRASTQCASITLSTCYVGTNNNVDSQGRSSSKTLVFGRRDTSTQL